LPLNNNHFPQFNPGDNILILTDHLPMVEAGSEATIVSQQFGELYSVLLPDGHPYLWLAGFELQAIGSNPNKHLQVGDSAQVLTEEGHTPEVHKGDIVKIIKISQPTFFYDVILKDGLYHRWLGEFEMIPSIR